MGITEIVIIAGICLALFGPKALQSMARSAGQGVKQAKDMKDKIVSDLQVDDLPSFSNPMSNIPRNSRDAVKMLLSNSDDEKDKEQPAKATAEKPAEKKIDSVKPQEAN